MEDQQLPWVVLGMRVDMFDCLVEERNYQGKYTVVLPASWDIVPQGMGQVVLYHTNLEHSL